MTRRGIKKTLDISYNLDYLVIVPNRDNLSFEAFDYTFGNAILFNNTVEDVEFFVQFLKKNLIGQLIFVDYYGEYNEIINTLVDEHRVKFIFTRGLGELSDVNVLNEFSRICEMYDCGIIDEIGFLDHGLQKSVHGKRRNTKHVLLDLPENKVETSEDRTVGILNHADSDYESFYNELGSFAFLPDYAVKMTSQMELVMKFVREYGIKTKIVEKREELFSNNVCNLDVNFAGARVTTFIKSMDRGIPCVVGNNGFLAKEYQVMNKYLVVRSDDDVEEIAKKVKGAIENKDTIMREYEKFRGEHRRRAKVLVQEFLGLSKREKKQAEYEKLLTVVVPVYNTEKYLAKCLDSVISAQVLEMEILIINDGSTDKSGKIAKEYVGKYPDLVRYIEQKNRGLGNVRNVGLKEARGEYIASVDSDDTIQPGMLKDALPYMKDGVDVIICDWMSVGEKESFETAALDWVFEKRKEMEGLLYTTIMPSTCNKIMKKSLFDEGIWYLEEKYEDLSANPRVLLRAEKVKYIHKPYYNYYLRDNSLMRSRINPEQMVDALCYLDGRLKVENEAINVDEFKYYTYAWRIEEYIINPLYEMKGKELEKAEGYIYEKIFRLMTDVLESKYYKEMLRKLKSKELREYIKERNEAIKKKGLGAFIVKAKKPQKLSAGIVYYGD